LKIFEILDLENKGIFGTLLYFERTKTFIVELPDSINEWSCPFFFSSFVKKRIYTIPRDESLNWVRTRIIPSSRQNISSVLKTHKMKEYDEIRLIELSRGICSNDSLFIRQTDKLPEYVSERQKINITGCSILSDKKILLMYSDDSLRIIDLHLIKEYKDVDKLLVNDELFRSCKYGAGGYYITFNNSIDIPSGLLYKKSEKISLTKNDLFAFISYGLIDTSEVCDSLECSRQNLAYLVKKNQLTPVKENVKGNLFLRSDACE
jgi:hypothetical protein